MGRIITLTGEAGTGKSTIASKLIDWGGFDLVKSTTTRVPRSSDLFGEYEHLSELEFGLLAAGGAFIWNTNYAGNYYGTKVRYIARALESGINYIMILVPEVVPKLFEHTNKVIPFFVKTPKEAVLRERMQLRGDSQDDIVKRLSNLGNWEIEARNSGIPYRFITNDKTPDMAVRQLLTYL